VTDRQYWAPPTLALHGHHGEAGKGDRRARLNLERGFTVIAISSRCRHAPFFPVPVREFNATAPIAEPARAKQPGDARRQRPRREFARQNEPPGSASLDDVVTLEQHPPDRVLTAARRVAETRSLLIRLDRPEEGTARDLRAT
jgi:hypothetical protein